MFQNIFLSELLTTVYTMQSLWFPSFIIIIISLQVSHISGEEVKAENAKFKIHISLLFLLSFYLMNKILKAEVSDTTSDGTSDSVYNKNTLQIFMITNPATRLIHFSFA